MEDLNMQNLSLRLGNLEFPQFPADWNMMPSEILCEIVNHLDIPERLQLKKVSKREEEIVNQSRRKPNVKVEVTFNVLMEGNPPVIDVFVFDQSGARRFWFLISDLDEETVVISYIDSKCMVEKYRAHKTSPQTLSSIVRWILTEKSFNVVELKFNLEKSRHPLDINLDCCYIPFSILNGCENVKSTPFTVSDQSIVHEAAVLLTKADFITVMNARNIIYSEIEEHSIFDTFRWNWLIFCVIIDPINEPIGTFEVALQFVRSLTRVHPKMEQVFSRGDVIARVESEKCINKIMMFICAYRHDGSNRVTYLNSNPGFEEKITFLRKGLEESIHLGDFQLTVLIFLFRLRLVLDEPGVTEFYEEVCAGFKLVETNYEAIMPKIETLMEDI